MATLDRRGRVAGRAGVRDMGGDDRDRAGFIVETLMLTPYGIREGRTRLSCRSWPTEAAAKHTMEAYAAVFHRIDSLGRAPSYVTVTLNAWNCPGKAALDIFQAERNDYEITQGILALVGGDTRLRRQWSGPKLNPALIDADRNHQSLGVGAQIINLSLATSRIGVSGPIGLWSTEGRTTQRVRRPSKSHGASVWARTAAFRIAEKTCARFYHS